MLRRLAISIVAFSLSACSSFPQVFTSNSTSRLGTGYRVRENLVYTPVGWPAPLLGDLYQPLVKRRAPAVLLIHGGGWTGGDGRWQMAPIAKRLARRGFVVLNVTYRLAPRWRYPAPIADLNQAVLWLRAHAEELGIDSQKIATFGYSAGGHLAALTGLEPSNHICAIVAGGAPCDLELFGDGLLVRQFLGGSPRTLAGRYREASPIRHVRRGSPPVFLFHGSGDRLVPPEHAEHFASMLAQKNVRHQLYWIEGRDHIPAFVFPARSIDFALDFLTAEMPLPR
jgi:acetyl esterase/lipase